MRCFILTEEESKNIDHIDSVSPNQITTRFPIHCHSPALCVIVNFLTILFYFFTISHAFLHVNNTLLPVSSYNTAVRACPGRCSREVKPMGDASAPTFAALCLFPSGDQRTLWIIQDKRRWSPTAETASAAGSHCTEHAVESSSEIGTLDVIVPAFEFLDVSIDESRHQRYAHIGRHSSPVTQRCRLKKSLTGFV